MKTKNIKVQYSNRYQANGGFLPKIQMEGKWLEALGFAVGTQLVVEYEEGSIRIRPLSEEELRQKREEEVRAEFQRKLRELRVFYRDDPEMFAKVAEAQTPYASKEQPARKSRKRSS
ncbi:MAG: type I toxin-antitoxin system SymE family toxin [Lachnospiraceae bacterium]|nr:type I toxin-antitoxin system SymE family toxin [Lachnospiraceae bacterium]